MNLPNGVYVREDISHFGTLHDIAYMQHCHASRVLIDGVTRKRDRFDHLQLDAFHDNLYKSLFFHVVHHGRSRDSAEDR